MQRRGIRVSVTALAAGVVAVTLLAASLWLVLAQRNTLTAGLDRTLEGRASDVAALLASGGIPSSLTPADAESFVQVVGGDGSVILATANVAGEGPLVEVADGELTFMTVEDLPVDDDRFRVHVRPVAGVGAVIAGTTFDVVDEATSALARSLFVAGPLLTAFLAVLTWVLVGRTLRPVEAIRTEVAGIGSGDLDRRVPVASTDDEISRLAETMNAMLARIEEAAVRQRRFVDDASHELRSPLARMRAVLDIDLREIGPETPIESLREEVTEMQSLVDDLLFLARADRQQSGNQTVQIDLEDLVLAEAERVVLKGRVPVDLSAVSGAQVVGDPARLRRVVRNLLDNAERHADSRVLVSVAQSDGKARVVIADDGPGVPADAAEGIFDRFARLDESRTATTGGTGLGLAIAREIAIDHGGSLQIDNPGEHGARFVLELPLSR